MAADGDAVQVHEAAEFARCIQAFELVHHRADVMRPVPVEILEYLARLSIHAERRSGTQCLAAGLIARMMSERDGEVARFGCRAAPLHHDVIDSIEVALAIRTAVRPDDDRQRSRGTA